MALRHLYLHGFASGPNSTKGVRFAEQFAALGRPLDRLDLRVPSFEHLRLSAMIATTQAAIGGPDDRAIVIGSSLGGLTAAWTAARDPRVVALVLLAPAFELVTRWEAQLGEDWERWRTSGWREVPDHVTGGNARIDFGFVEDARAIDVGMPALAVPTLILHGTRDDTVPIATSQQLAATNPHVRLVELDDGHQLAASLPRLLTETEAFLAALPG